MRGFLKSATALAMAVGLALGLPVAARPAGIHPLMLMLNGEGTKIGTITVTSGGAAKNNTDTATPFSIKKGSVIKVVCDAQANICIGTSCHGTITNASFGPWESDGTRDKPIFITLTDDSSDGGTTNVEKVMSVISTGSTTNCAFFQMN